MATTKDGAQIAGGAHVTGQTPGTRQVAGGRFVDGMVVHFVTATGVASTVFVPETQYNADNVRAMIAQKAATIDEVSALGNG